MAQTNTALTDTTLYPVYATKAALLADLEDVMALGRGGGLDKLKTVLYRLSNTNTDSDLADDTVRHDNL